MTPFYADEWLTILEGDCRVVLPSLPADSVDCVVTSPPYWGLRDYGTASWIGGDEACDHIASYGAGRPGRETPGGRGGTFPHNDIPHKEVCGKCGATRQDSQLGLERTPEEYVANLVAVFAGVRRVLKPSGTCWLNLGDSYFGTGKGPTHPTGLHAGDNGTSFPSSGVYSHDTLKGKDLVGIPWRVAFALQADGWYLRSDIIWSKPNPMPESVTDRPTKAHEYLFLLTKSARYYFDADAVREDAISAGETRGGGSKASTNGIHVGRADGQNLDRLGQLPTAAGRNIRSVWTIATRPYPGAHFAVFPPELPERCIKAGSSERGVCPECGAPWERVGERTGVANDANEVLDDYDVPGLSKRSSADRVRRLSGATYQRVVAPTNAWRPTCGHTAILMAGGEAPLVPSPAVVLDPFAGSGTVGMVANRLSRRAILIDLNPEYLRQQMTRNAQTPLGLGAA